MTNKPPIEIDWGGRHPVSAPYWPRLSAEAERSLGRFVIAWNVLEQEIDQAIAEVLRLDHSLGSAVTANLGPKAKLEIFQSAFHNVASAFLTIPVAEVDKLIADTGKSNGKSRTFIVHGRPYRLKLEGGVVPIWIKIRAGKGGIRGSLQKLGTKGFANEIKEVRALVIRWNDLRKRMTNGIHALDAIAHEEYEGYWRQETERLRRRLLRSRRGSRQPSQQLKPQASPAKSP